MTQPAAPWIAEQRKTLHPSTCIELIHANITNRRGTWSEVTVAGAKPRARCCTALFALEQRVLMFGGDTYGALRVIWQQYHPSCRNAGLYRVAVLVAWHAQFQKAAPHPTHCLPH